MAARPAAAEGKTRTPPNGGSFAGSPAPPPPHPQHAHAQSEGTTPPHPRSARRSALPAPNTARPTNPTTPTRGPQACPTRSAASSPPHDARGQGPGPRAGQRGTPPPLHSRKHACAPAVHAEPRSAAPHTGPARPRGPRPRRQPAHGRCGSRTQTGGDPSPPARQMPPGAGPRPQKARTQGKEHDKGAHGITETRLGTRPTLQASGEHPQPRAEIVHRLPARTELLH